MISGKILRDAIISGANNINNQRSRVDELNVFPVPDGDTATNFTLYKNLGKLDALGYRKILYCNENTIVANGGRTIREYSDGYPIPIQKF